MNKIIRKCFVMGGGGFVMEPDNLLLDHYILSLAEKPKPNICFIGTATGDSDWYIDRFYGAYQKLNCTPTHLSLFRPKTRDLESFVFNQDIIHVGGGNTKNLLCLWKDWGLDQIIKSAYQQGVVLSRLSAGMICWFEEGLTDSFGGLDPLKCLGFLKGSATPHFDGEPERRAVYLNLIKTNVMQGGLALDDGVGALYKDEALVECVSSRVEAKAYQFKSKTAEEKRLPVRVLG